jgi:chromosome transmission fidelity protein 4
LLSLHTDGRVRKSNHKKTIRTWRKKRFEKKKTFFPSLFSLSLIRNAPIRFLVSGGDDGVSKVWRVSDLVPSALDAPRRELASCDSAAGAVTAVAVSGARFVAGTRDFHVTLCSVAGGGVDKLLLRCTARITDLAFRPDGTFVAVAAEDGSLSVVNVADCSAPVRWPAHDAAVESLAYAPDGNTLVSLGADGSVRMWNLEDNSLIWKKLLVPKQPPLAWFKRRLLFHPDGELVAVPAGANVLFVDATTGAERGALVKGHTDAVASIAYSPNGAYLATAAHDCQLLVWDCKSRETVDRFKTDVPLVEIAWQANLLALLTEDGQLAVWPDVISPDMPSPVDAAKPKPLTAAAKLAALFDNSTAAPADAPTAAAADDAAAEDAALLAAVDAAEAALGRAVEANGAAAAAAKAKPRRLVRKFGDTDADDADESRAPLLAAAAAGGGGSSAASGGVAAPRAQAAFMPNASPADRKRRFLAWNMVGVVLLRDEGGHAFVEIEFSDQSQNRNAHFTDHNGVSMAALNERATVFGSRADALNHVAAALHYRPHGAASSGGAWTVRLPAGVDVLALAIGASFVAAATNENAVRLFSATGVQLSIIALPGAPVCVAGAGHRLAIVSAAPDNVGRALSVELLDVAQQSAIVKREPLPLSGGGAALTWFGINSEGAPVSYDSDGVLRVRDFAFGGQWVPILVAKDACKSSETLWPVACRNDVLLGVVTPDREPPMCVPRPPLTVLTLAPPFAQAENANTALERAYLLGQQQALRWEHLAEADRPPAADQHRARLAMDATLLKLFTAACKADKLERASELVERIQVEKSLTIAARMAGSTRHHALSEQIGQLIYARRDQAAAAAAAATTAALVASFDGPRPNVVVHGGKDDDADADEDDAADDGDADGNDDDDEEDSAELSANALREREKKRKAQAAAVEEENASNKPKKSARTPPTKVAPQTAIAAAAAAVTAPADADSVEASLFRDKKRGNPFAKKAAAATTEPAQKRKSAAKVMQSFSKFK